MLCAIEAGKRRRRVAVSRHAGATGEEDPYFRRRALQFTNSTARRITLFEQSALPSRHWRATLRRDFIALVEKHRIPYHEKLWAKLFCDRSAQDILTCWSWMP